MELEGGARVELVGGSSSLEVQNGMVGGRVLKYALEIIS